MDARARAKLKEIQRSSLISLLRPSARLVKWADRELNYREPHGLELGKIHTSIWLRGEALRLFPVLVPLLPRDTFDPQGPLLQQFDGCLKRNGPELVRLLAGLLLPRLEDLPDEKALRDLFLIDRAFGMALYSSGEADGPVQASPRFLRQDYIDADPYFLVRLRTDVIDSYPTFVPGKWKTLAEPRVFAIYLNRGSASVEAEEVD